MSDELENRKIDLEGRKLDLEKRRLDQDDAARMRDAANKSAEFNEQQRSAQFERAYKRLLLRDQRSMYSRILDWYKAISPVLLALVASTTAYLTIHKHEQTSKDYELKLKGLAQEQELRLKAQAQEQELKLKQEDHSNAMMMGLLDVYLKAEPDPQKKPGDMLRLVKALAPEVYKQWAQKQEDYRINFADGVNGRDARTVSCQGADALNQSSACRVQCLGKSSNILLDTAPRATDDKHCGELAQAFCGQYETYQCKFSVGARNKHSSAPSPPAKPEVPPMEVPVRPSGSPSQDEPPKRPN